MIVVEPKDDRRWIAYDENRNVVARIVMQNGLGSGLAQYFYISEADYTRIQHPPLTSLVEAVKFLEGRESK